MFWYVLLFRTSHFCKGRCWELKQTCRWRCCFCSCLRFHGDRGDHDHDDDDDGDDDDHEDDDDDGGGDDDDDDAAAAADDDDDDDFLH